MEELLADTTKFLKVDIQPGKDFNHIHNQQLKISKTLRTLVESGAMTSETYDVLNPTGTAPSVMYGLSKVHKPTVDNIPKLRPILSAINSPTYKLSQYINVLLKPFTTNVYTAKDSFAFSNDIQTQDPSHYMASLDVDSLFTNIPLYETIDICADLLFRDNPIVDGLNKSEFKQLLTLATTESFILFNGSYYRQIDGVAMGSPLGPTLANIFLGYNEEKWLADCPAEFKPVYYRRYVDDIFVLFRQESCLAKFQEYLNNKHINMNFTCEKEVDGSLPFLDVHVSRNIPCFTTSVYRKPTFSGVFTNFNSFIPASYKMSLVSTLLYRAHAICSNWKQIHSEFEKVKSLMLKNGFPSVLLDRLISKI